MAAAQLCGGFLFSQFFNMNSSIQCLNIVYLILAIATRLRKKPILLEKYERNTQQNQHSAMASPCFWCCTFVDFFPPLGFLGWNNGKRFSYGYRRFF